MEAVAKAKYLKCSARKMRQVADMIRNRPVDTSISLLFSMKKYKKSAEMVDKVLKSAIANLRDKHAEANVGTEQLKVKSVTVDAGPIMKRFRPRAQGRAYHIHKNLCHLTLSVSD